MYIKNSVARFGLVAILFHWIMAVIIIGMLGLGLYMVSLPFNAETLKLYGWHKEYGILILILVFFRLLWRFYNVVPELNLPWFEQIAARSMHIALYLFMIVMPLTGWLISSAAGIPVSFFGLFSLPGLIPENERALAFFGMVHEWLAYALIAAICVHFAAALKHHFIDKDDIFRRILP